ncbi:alcohol dehydrogenase [Rhodotorula toruloides]|uniref:Alcohol dehydrogenase n=1 Tax=Rhodotorula toruloides TaxID=5286 RepID=A0A511K785_RHOTO|nr:alcohol dehydrogenase [Rhodotorula toruloides]
MAMNAGANALEKNMQSPPTGIHAGIANPSLQKKGADPSGDKMKALIWEGKMKVKVEEALKPKIVDAKDIVIKVTGSTVCGSDMHLLAGAIIELRKGDILGHECMGIVDSVGPGVTKLKVGDRVVAGFNIGCGECFMCQKKLSSACQMTNDSALMNTMYGGRTCGILGYSHFTGGFAGGQAEFVRIPYGDANCVKVPEGVYDEDALYISDSLVTSFHQVEDTRVDEGDIVGIWGVGVIGLLVGKWSILRGASRLIAVDSVQWRLDYFKEKLHKDHPNVQIDLVNFSEHKNVVARIHELTKAGTRGLPDTRPDGLDVAFECAAGEYAKGWAHKLEIVAGLETDTSEILNEMIESTIGFGRVGITGVYAGYTNHFNIGSLMQRGIRFIGNGQAPTHKYMDRVMNDYLATGKVKPRELFVTHRVPIEDTDKVYYHMREHSEKTKIIKAFVATAASAPPAPGAPPLTRIE